jgi:hypothetical protein
MGVLSTPERSCILNIPQAMGNVQQYSYNAGQLFLYLLWNLWAYDGLDILMGWR